MEKQTPAIANLLSTAEKRFGFKFAVELHHALRDNEPQARELLRKVLAK